MTAVRHAREHPFVQLPSVAGTHSELGPKIRAEND